MHSQHRLQEAMPIWLDLTVNGTWGFLAVLGDANQLPHPPTLSLHAAQVAQFLVALRCDSNDLQYLHDTAFSCAARSITLRQNISRNNVPKCCDCVGELSIHSPQEAT
jgi:hypothetical protein